MRDRFRRKLIISLAVIAGSFLVVGAAIYFIGLDLQLQTEKIGTARALIGNRSAVLGSLADLKKDAAEAATYKQALDMILVSQDQLLNFKNWLDGLARVHGVEYNFSFQGDPVLPSSDSPGYYNFVLDISGAQNDLTAFMGEIEYGSPRFLTSLSTFDLSGSGDNYKVSIQGSVYFK